MKLQIFFRRRARNSIGPSLKISAEEAHSMTIDQLAKFPDLSVRRLAHPGSIPAFVNVGRNKVVREFINKKLSKEQREVFVASASLYDRLALAEPELVIRLQRWHEQIRTAFHHRAHQPKPT